MLRYAVLLKYTSVQTYKLLLQQFPLISLSLLKKLTEGGIESLKAAKVLLEQGKIGLVLFCSLVMFIYKKIHNIKMGNLLVLKTKEIYTKML